jgi:hypothetical protein
MLKHQVIDFPLLNHTKIDFQMLKPRWQETSKCSSFQQETYHKLTQTRVVRCGFCTWYKIRGTNNTTHFKTLDSILNLRISNEYNNWWEILSVKDVLWFWQSLVLSNSAQSLSFLQVVSSLYGHVNKRRWEDFIRILSLGEASIRTLECCLKWIMSLHKTFKIYCPIWKCSFIPFVQEDLCNFSSRDQKKTNLTSDFDNDSTEASDTDVSLQTCLQVLRLHKSRFKSMITSGSDVIRIWFRFWPSKLQLLFSRLYVLWHIKFIRILVYCPAHLNIH